MEYYDEIVLPKPSVARCGHIDDICEKDLRRKIGKVHLIDQIRIKAILAKMQIRSNP